MLGILREDAVLIPFAIFDGKVWQSPWGAPEVVVTPLGFAREAPKRTFASTTGRRPDAWWGGRAPGTEWELLTVGRYQKVRVANVTTYQNRCTRGTGLLTDFESRVRIRPNSYPLPYAGIAATTSNLLRPVTEVMDGTADFEAIERLLPALFERVERSVWKDTQQSDDRPRLTGSLPRPEVSSVYSSTLPDRREVFAFHARRHLPQAINRKPLELVTTVVGWLNRGVSSSFTLIDARESQSDLDGKGGDDELIPRAALMIGERTFWAGNTAGYEWETYFVLEVTGGVPGALISVDGGGC
jgi:hypothetical protein